MDDDRNPDEELGIKNAIREIQSLSLDLLHEATSFNAEMFSSPFDIFDAENGLETLEEIVKKLRENVNIISGETDH